MLRFDGLYVAPVLPTDGKVLCRHCLRFFADGTLVSVSSQATDLQLVRWVAAVARWLTKESRYGRGVYQIEDNLLLEGNLLRFTTRDDPDEAELREDDESRPVIVDYEGEIRGDNLTLRLYSHYNGYQATQSYSFVAFEP